MSARRLLLVAVLVICAGCSSGPIAPAALDSKQDACASCRMVVSDARFASQIVAPLDDPKFFDDLGCLTRYLNDHSPVRDAVIYVADHRTRAWVSASSAVYTEMETGGAPMGSRVIAHASAESRDQDPAAAGGRPADVNALFPNAWGRSR